MNTTALPMPERISHSQLTSYMNCSEQYRLSRRRGLGESVSWALVGGSAFHSWTELYDQDIPVDPEQFQQFFDAQAKETVDNPRNSLLDETGIKPTGRASKEWPGKRDRKWWEHHGPIFCQQYVDWRNDPDNPIMPQGSTFTVEMEVRGVLGGIETLGKIDRLVLDSPLGEPCVLDLKTGKEPGTGLQIATYAILAAEQLDMKPINVGYFYLAEKGELSNPVDLTRYTREIIDGMYSSVRRGIEQGVYTPNPNAFCSTCAVKQYCGLYGNRPPEDIPITEAPII